MERERLSLFHLGILYHACRFVSLIMLLRLTLSVLFDIFVVLTQLSQSTKNLKTIMMRFLLILLPTPFPWPWLLLDVFAISV